VKGIGIVMLIAIVSAGCAPAPAAGPAGLAPADETAIRAIIADWDRAWSMNDASAAVAHYADDYVEMRATAVVGRDAARAVYEGFAVTYTSSTSTVKRLEGVGHLAYVWADYNARFTNSAGAARQQRGNLLWVLKKDDAGAWRIAASGSQAARSALEGE
jgi:uncharacterized protein (TIGR02246 family)